MNMSQEDWANELYAHLDNEITKVEIFLSTPNGAEERLVITDVSADRWEEDGTTIAKVIVEKE